MQSSWNFGPLQSLVLRIKIPAGKSHRRCSRQLRIYLLVLLLLGVSEIKKTITTRSLGVNATNILFSIRIFKYSS